MGSTLNGLLENSIISPGPKRNRIAV